MTGTYLPSLLAPSGIAFCCALALLETQRRCRRVPRGAPGKRPVLPAIAALPWPIFRG